MKTRIKLDLAGMSLCFELKHPDTADYFPAAVPAGTDSACPTVRLTEEDWKYYLSTEAEDCAHSEYNFLTAACSDAILPYDRIVIHAVALRYRDKAYLICANSGVGKSTQARFLRELRPGAFDIICGDRPVLEFRDPVSAGRNSPRPLYDAYPTPVILAHPSPWNGKENWYGADAAPLAGLILLERGEENRLYSMTERDASLFVYAQMIQTSVNPENIKRAAELTTRLLAAVPIWKLITHDVPASTKLLLGSVF